MNRQDINRYNIPDTTGVYLFKKGGSILYIGKATSLKDRIKSYFLKEVINTRGPLIVDMVFKADKIDFIKTDSVLEALILESKLIKEHQPKYNTKEKDDRSYNYVVITDEDFPRVLIERGRNLSDENLKANSIKLKAKYGPFTNGTQLREALKIVRKIFPFRDRCLPAMISQQNINSQKQNINYSQSNNKKDSINKEIISGATCILPRQSASSPRESAGCRPCFNYQIGLCPGVCIGKISKIEYAKTIRNIKLFFEGKKKIILKNLEKEMHTLAKVHEFEKASQIKKTIFALNHILDIAVIASEAWQSKNFSPTANSLQLKANYRIEAYDIAHLSGTNNVGVMTVMENGEINKKEYRKFLIRESEGSDIDALKEILERRFKHPEWTFPQIIVVDGGKAQINIARKVILKAGNGLSIPARMIRSSWNLQKGEALRSKISKIKVVSVLKDKYHKPKIILGDRELSKEFSDSILIANSEAHRFAVKYHRSKRRII
jgi:excinuclease ABC subunit C